jgi:hypothetical protein
MAKKGLGKGLGALFEDNTQSEVKNSSGSSKEVELSDNKEAKDIVSSKPLSVSISKVSPNQNQPRKDFDETLLNELAESIKQYGIIQPIIVKKIDKDRYEIIAGERRWRAAQICGLKEVPIIIKEFSDREAMEISIIENIQRSDLNPIEEALGYKALMTEYGLTQEEVAKKVSKNRSTITNSIRLLKLSEKVQKMMIEGLISTGHCKVLLSISDTNIQDEVADEIVVKQMSVRELEKYVKKLLKPVSKRNENKFEDRNYDLFLRDYEENIRLILGTKVHINRKDKNKGRIEIDYYSDTELERIIELIKTIK